jgi:hypothetical protein
MPRTAMETGIARVGGSRDALKRRWPPLQERKTPVRMTAMELNENRAQTLRAT